MQDGILKTMFVGGLAGAVSAWLVTSYSPATPNLPENRDQMVTTQVVDSHEEQIVATVEAASPAVVSIVITQDVPVIEEFFDDFSSPFGGFFNFRVPSLRQNGTERREVGGGSGFLISDDGMIVTNRHVVDEDEAEYTVFLQNGEQYEAQVIARDPVNDIAILQIEEKGLDYLEFASSDEVRVGQSVIAIGNALSEFQNSVSVGIVSGLARSITAGDGRGQSELLEEVIQTDAAINPGNSGGPLLNLSGQVIGVNVAVALGSENIGFALPADLVGSIVESVKKDGRIVRPYLGVRYVPVTELVATQNNLEVDFGVLIVRGEEITELAVIPNSPAARAGLLEGDVILEIDGERLDETRSLASAVRRKEVGQTVILKIWRNGSELDINVTLEEAGE